MVHLERETHRVSSNLVSIVKKKKRPDIFDETHERNAGKLPVVPFLQNCGSNVKDETHLDSSRRNQFCMIDEFLNRSDAKNAPSAKP